MAPRRSRELACTTCAPLQPLPHDAVVVVLGGVAAWWQWPGREDVSFQSLYACRGERGKRAETRELHCACPGLRAFERSSAVGQCRVAPLLRCIYPHAHAVRMKFCIRHMHMQ
eukprot:5950499-Prymnesium_polylepis.1